MKYITQDWTSTKDGYLFFVQRLQEMLFHYSDDIVKAPVHNTQTLLEEYVDTEKDVVKGSIKQYQLDIIAKEIKSSLMTDVIVRELYKYEVIEEMAKFLDKDQRTAVHYIFNKIPKKKYYEICCKYLKENLSESNRKTEIEKGLRAWLIKYITYMSKEKIAKNYGIFPKSIVKELNGIFIAYIGLEMLLFMQGKAINEYKC